MRIDEPNLDAAVISHDSSDTPVLEDFLMRSRILATFLVVIGTLFSLFVVFFKQEGNSDDYVSSMIQIAGPWLVADVLVVWLRCYRGIALAAAPMLLLELYIYYGVFINPQSSTDAVAYVFKPGVQLLIVLPIGLLIGRVLDKRVTAAANKVS